MLLKTTFLLLMTMVLWSLCSAVRAGDRLTPAAGRAGRSVTLATHGMVATSHPLAVQIGLDVLKNGGNAVDAAIAVNAALGLMEPMSCGIGGDLYALVWDAKTQKLYGLNASGRSPYQATRDVFAAKGLDEIPTSGPLSWSVPGCVDGWEELRKRFGTRTLAQLLEPSIRYAEEGFPVSSVIAGYWQGGAARLRRHPDAARTYLIDKRAPRAGEVFKNPALARSYRLLAEKGRDAFYKGAIARAIVAFSDKNGGLFSLKDFADHTSTWVEPVSTRYRGYQVWEIPPPGQGIAVLEMLNLLEGYDLKKMGPESADWWHLFLEAKKLAYADRARFYADPDFVKVPVKELISKPYAAQRRKLIDMGKAMTRIPAGDPKLEQGDTVYLCVVDKDRNCVSLIQSNYFGFGSGLVSGALGFALQNRGCLFALEANHANRLEPHKRPFHTIIPSLVTKDGSQSFPERIQRRNHPGGVRTGVPWLVFGVMGGDMQPQGQVQVLVNLIDFGMNVQEAGEAPRLEHVGSATPTGLSGNRGGGTVYAERGISEKVIKELIRRGHRVKTVRTNGGGYQGILIDPKTNVLHGGSEARKDGCAAGY
ncbi:MAG TPA: gamma-glutamyltransferase [Gemmataceae bacterium]|nr:gamma-glutamyltransferase [Gemmataceae bacterium]